MAKVIFWLMGFIIAYTYFGYSLLLYLISLMVNNKVKKKNIEPPVTFLITSYNEEGSIRQKLENTLNLDYPKDKLEIIVASDGSTDKTDEIVKEFKDKGVILHRVEGRVGKTETQNQTVKVAKGDIIIFSDATTEYHKDAIKKIVRNYNDPTVGAVSGRYEYIDPKGTQVGLATILFWRYENFIKSRQTRIKTITGACGCIYSVRRELYEPLRKDVISDLVEPLKILEKGYRIAFEPEAVAYEQTTEKTSQEFNMRIRVISRGMNGLLSAKSLLNPLRYGFVSFQLFSHKVLRWLIPFFVTLLFFANLALLGKNFYNLIFILQVFFYLFALLGWIVDRFNKKIKLFSLPLYFCVVNLASAVSLIRTIWGEKHIVWETTRS